MQRLVFLGLAFLMALSTACLHTEEIPPDEDGDLAGDANHPFYVAVFDHSPTEEEIQTDLEQFLTAGYDPIDPVPLPLQPGQKLVRIDATTSDREDAGTERASQVRLDGVWRRGNGALVSAPFVLNHPTRDDLNRNTVNIFYYVLNVGPGTRDRFVRGRIANFSTDGWHCNNIVLTESNRLGTTRRQSLPFNQWVDSPRRTRSSWIYATSNSWLSY